ncbi:sigma-54 interaction domain-containing protein [Desulfomonile tiedjei]|uniref:PAS domain S-box n=1 Tax=Desulfomonile tiedjei (strain ATCC 49306 / DSM 6799 / DCB-1) TaxID=706587 RepID=I4C1R2_DESTA|nr:sigma 54-interacting transcriptional regulator [Desulfomonile tiedjei]AFM23503.1 PAS domain S-box [Desulfomonile tiedjei DSM 6799]
MNTQRADDISTIFTHSSDGLVLSDREGRMLRLNPAFRRVSGLPNKLAIGYRANELVESGLLSDSAIARVADTAKESTVTLITAAKKEVLATARPILDDAGGMVGIVCNLRNLGFFHRKNRSKPATDPLQSEEHQGIVAQSPKMLQTLELATDLAKLDCNILIFGETGVGKGLLAHYVYSKSTRAQTGSFLKINCSAIPASLFESELFGYERGAFSGALETGKPGLVEMADKGVLFLDEIGDMPPEQQAKLLTVIEDGSYVRVGGTSQRQVDVRIIAATNRDLTKLVSKGHFREDLYYRIAVVPIHIPPLRDRQEDIKRLLLHFQGVFSEKHSRKRVLSPQLCDCLCRYSWPGNVRELANLVECLIVTGKEEVLSERDLSRSFPFASLCSTPEKPFLACSESESLKDLLANYELELVKRAIEQSSSYTEAARLLKTSLSTINRHARRLKGANKSVAIFAFALQSVCSIVSSV